MNTIDGSTALALAVTGIVFAVLLYVWIGLALSAVFRKSGEEPWKGWVPILNHIVVLQLGGLSGWLYLLVLVPFIGPLLVWVCIVIAAHRINLAFGYGAGMTVLAALLFPVWATVLGAGSARWIGRERVGGGPVRTGSPEVSAPPPLAADSAWPLAAAASYEPRPPVPPRPPAPPVPPAPVADQPAGQPAATRAGWTPPPLPSTAAPLLGAGIAFDDESDWTGEVTGAISGAPAPISAVPLPPPPPAAPAVPPTGRRGIDDAPPVTRVPVAPPLAAQEPWAPTHSPVPGEAEAFPETSGPVSAIAGAPDAGGPRSALASVSAQHVLPHIPDEDALDQTIIARRKRTGWVLAPRLGAPIPLTSPVAILGRRPGIDPDFPGAQLVSLDDDTRTISKTHARLALRDDRWYITDLDSTNGVLFTTLMGTEVAATPGEEVEAGDLFFLGDAEIRLTRSDG